MSPTKSTRQQLVKVAQIPCLYRHSLSGRYYGIKKVSGKRKERFLGPGYLLPGAGRSDRKRG